MLLLVLVIAGLSAACSSRVATAPPTKTLSDQVAVDNERILKIEQLQNVSDSQKQQAIFMIQANERMAQTLVQHGASNGQH